MPEEFRVWKERVDAAVARRKAALQQSATQALSTSTSVISPPAVASSTPITSPLAQPTSENAPRENAKSTSEHKKHSHSNQSATSEVTPVVEPITYATPEAAVEAFRSLLDEFQVTSSMKYKEVQELCSHDQRWNALKTSGEKKQNLAEFQTKKMKQEKEMKKVLARRARDNFFLLLAECQAIDSSTRWRDAIVLLENDKRYKEVESSSEREDYYNDFITELKKRERAEREEMKRDLIHEYQLLLQSLVDSKKITYQSNWNEIKSEMIEVFNKGKLNHLEEFEKRRVFQDLVHELISLHREEERKARQEKLEMLQCLKEDFHKEIEQQLLISFNSGGGDGPRWRDMAPMLEISSSFQKILNFNDAERMKQQQHQSPSLKLFSPRDIFEEYMANRREELRFHRRILFDILGGYQVEVTHKTSIEDEMLPKLQEIFDLNKEKEGKRNGGGPVAASVLSYQLSFKEMATLQNLLTTKKHLLLQVLNEILARKREDWEERERHRRKLEDRYLDLLDELFNRSDQIDISWEEAKQELSGCSAFESLGKTERKRFFYEHMRELRQKLEVKLIKTNEVKQLEEIKLQEVLREKEEEAAAVERKEVQEKQEREALETRVASCDHESGQESEERGHEDSRVSHHENRRSSSRRRERDSEDRHSMGSVDSERRDYDSRDSGRRKRQSGEDSKEEDHHDISRRDSHRKRSRHESSDREDGEESHKGSKSHKKDKKEKDRDRDRDRERDKSSRDDKDRGRKHKKVMSCPLSLLS